MSASKPVAAFFDLDKTIIAKSSTLAFSKPFFDGGLINRRSVLKSSYAQFLFLVVLALLVSIGTVGVPGTATITATSSNGMGSPTTTSPSLRPPSRRPRRSC